MNLTIGENGIFKRAESAVNRYEMASINEIEELKKIENIIDGITYIDEVPIPKGFYYVGGTKEEGLVISDNKEDENKYKELTTSGTTQIPSDSIIGNQFVWIPVNDPNAMFNEETVTLTGVETKNNKYSELTIRTGESYTAGKPGESEKVREPDVLSMYDVDEQYYKDILGYENLEDMAQDFTIEYNDMLDSIIKYEGFYVGRYELSGTIEKAQEKPGVTIKDNNWYELYNACRNLIKADRVKTTMIYGCQWDRICQWLIETEAKSESEVDIDSNSWGNFSGEIKETGSDSRYRVNNIYDFAGNVDEWTQEANSVSRTLRGGTAKESSINFPASGRSHDSPIRSTGNNTTRVIMYIKI